MGPMSRSSRSSSAGAGGGGGSLGELGDLGGHGGLGLDVEVAAQRLDGGLQAELHLGLVELRAPSLLARLLQTSFRVLALDPQPVESDGGGALGLALAATALAQLAELALDDGEPVGDQRGEVIDGGLLGVELDATHLDLAAGLDGTLEPGFHLHPTSLQELAALAQPGRPHLEIGPQGSHRRGPLLEVGLGVDHGAGPFGGVGLLGLQDRQGGLELGHACLLAAQPLTELVGVGAQGVGFGAGVASIGLHPLEPVGGRGALRIELVELAGQARLALAGLVEQRAGAVQARLRVRRRRGGGGGLARVPRRGRRRWLRWTRCRRASRWRRTVRRRG